VKTKAINKLTQYVKIMAKLTRKTTIWQLGSLYIDCIKHGSGKKLMLIIRLNVFYREWVSRGIHTQF
jgi:hypothetical protein